jgi:hypothetical protein
MSAQPPEDLSQLDARAVAAQRLECDRRLTRLFHRWGNLDRREMRELRRLHDERVRIAGVVPRLRRRTPLPERDSAL